MKSENVAFVYKWGQKMWLLCLKMRGQIWGYLGQMGHRRQIAQWVGTLTTHPGGTGFEPQRGLMIEILSLIHI